MVAVRRPSWKLISFVGITEARVSVFVLSVADRCFEEIFIGLCTLLSYSGSWRRVVWLIYGDCVWLGCVILQFLKCQCLQTVGVACLLGSRDMRLELVVVPTRTVFAESAMLLQDWAFRVLIGGVFDLLWFVQTWRSYQLCALALILLILYSVTSV